MRQKIGEMFFCFWDNYIWRCSNKLSLLRREDLSLAVNVLTNSAKILHLTKEDFFQTVVNKYGKGVLVQISTVFRPVYDVICRWVLQNLTF